MGSESMLSDRQYMNGRTKVIMRLNFHVLTCLYMYILFAEAQRRAGALLHMEWPQAKIKRVSESINVSCMSSEDEVDGEPTIFAIKKYTWHSDLWRQTLQEIDGKVVQLQSDKSAQRMLKRIEGQSSDRKPKLSEDQQWMCKQIQ